MPRSVHGVHLNRKIIGTGILITFPALAAFFSGQAFIFPSLGPSAFNLVLKSARENTARRVLGGHFIGIIMGLICYRVFASGMDITQINSGFSIDILRLVLSGIISVMLTTGAMLITKSVHSPACSTTLIVSLGLLSTFLDCVLIMSAVVIMYAAHNLLNKIYLHESQRVVR